LIGSVPVETDEDWDQKKNALRLQQCPKLFELDEHSFSLRRILDFGPIASDYFFWRR